MRSILGTKAKHREAHHDEASAPHEEEPRRSRTIFWIEDFLREDIPNARILTYGYNADVVGGLFQANNRNSISQHGRDLTAKIERDLENDVNRLKCEQKGSRLSILGSDHICRTQSGWDYCQRRASLFHFKCAHSGTQVLAVSLKIQNPGSSPVKVRSPAHKADGISCDATSWQFCCRLGTNCIEHGASCPSRFKQENTGDFGSQQRSS